VRTTVQYQIIDVKQREYKRKNSVYRGTINGYIDEKNEVVKLELKQEKGWLGWSRERRHWQSMVAPTPPLTISDIKRYQRRESSGNDYFDDERLLYPVGFTAETLKYSGCRYLPFTTQYMMGL
jgi:hypothetical protein